MTQVPGYVSFALFDLAPCTSGCVSIPDATFTAPVGPMGVRIADRTTGGQFVLGQNYPNPHLGETTIPFTLVNKADVRLIIFDQQHRKVAGVVRKGSCIGAHTITLNLTGLGLPAGDYVYELVVSNRYGTFCQSKTMTVLQATGGAPRGGL